MGTPGKVVPAGTAGIPAFYPQASRPGSVRGRGGRRLAPGLVRGGGAAAVALVPGLRAATVTGKVALLLAIALEVGLVPAAAGQPEHGRGHLPPHRVPATGRAGIGIGVGQLLQPVEAVAAIGAFESVDRHGNYRGNSICRFVWSAAPGSSPPGWPRA